MDAEAYRRARSLVWKYRNAKRAGWVRPGSRAKDNHAIQVPRTEVVGLAEQLSSALFAREYYLTELMNLRGYLEQLARGEHDSRMCPECGRTFRAGWMDGQCPYCAAVAGAREYVAEALKEGGGDE